MNFRPSTISSCARASPLRVSRMLLPLTLLLIALIPSTMGKTKIVDKKLNAELRCLCVKTITAVHLGIIQSVNVIKAGPHCSEVQVIAKLKNGKEICLDPEAPRIKKIIQKILEGDGAVA